jgi:hypothetical protein
VRWTCAEFHRFGDLGLFEGRRAMLIDGVLLEEGPVSPPHSLTLELVGEALRAAFGAGWRIRHPAGARPGGRRRAAGGAGRGGAGGGPARVTPPNQSPHLAIRRVS